MPKLQWVSTRPAFRATLHCVKRLVLIGLVVVAALSVGLYLLTSRSEPSPDERAQARDLPQLPSVPASRTRPGQPIPERPAPPVSAAEPAATSSAGASSGAREYVNQQGVLVRDHRQAEDAPEFNRLVTERPGPKKLEPRVVEGVRDTIYSSVRKCTEGMDSSTFGGKPRAQVEVIVSILGGQVSTDQALTKFNDVPDEQGTQMSTCIQSQIEEMAFAAAGHADIPQYRVTVAFPLK